MAFLPQPAFDRFGPAVPQSPIIMSIPHAGRDYPANFSDYARHSADQMIVLEDRFVDLLAEEVDAQGHVVIVARAPRAWIDLNRSENDVDPAMMQPPRRAARPLSAKARGGLGLIPRRTSGLGELWHTGISASELALRTTTIHRPYHEALEHAMEAAYHRFGVAILIDLHSMPPLPRSGQDQPPLLVIGDRFGRSCHDRYSARIAGLAEQLQIKTAFNIPYAGGYILDRHGHPELGRQAIQIEIDRSLYLDPTLCTPGLGMGCMQSLVTAFANALADEAISTPALIAAE
jgi:N-formylglutamate amidohydrolase